MTTSPQPTFRVIGADLSLYSSYEVWNGSTWVDNTGHLLPSSSDVVVSRSGAVFGNVTVAWFLPEPGNSGVTLTSGSITGAHIIGVTANSAAASVEATVGDGIAENCTAISGGQIHAKIAQRSFASSGGQLSANDVYGGGGSGSITGATFHADDANFGISVDTGGTLTASGDIRNDQTVAGLLSLRGTSAPSALLTVAVGSAATAQNMYSSGDTRMSVGVAGSLTVGNFDLGSSLPGNLTISAGGVAHIGGTMGSLATLTITGAGSSLDYAKQWHIGDTARGSLLVQNGATAAAPSILLAATAAAAGSNVQVIGSGSKLDVQADVDSKARTSVIVSDGGTLSVGGVLSLADDNASDNTVDVNGAGSKLITHGAFLFGNAGRFPGSTVRAGGMIDAQGDLSFGVQATGNATLSIRDADSKLVTHGAVTIGDSGFGGINVNNGATFDASLSTVTFALHSGSTGGILLSKFLSGTTGGTMTARDLVVGNDGTATFRIQDGSSVHVLNSLRVGAGLGSGNISLTGTGSLLDIGGDTIIADGGRGGISVGAGAEIDTHRVLIRYGTSGLTATGSGAIANINGDLTVGSGEGSGTASLFVSNGAQLNVTGTTTLGEQPSSTAHATLAGSAHNATTIFRSVDAQFDGAAARPKFHDLNIGTAFGPEFASVDQNDCDHPWSYTGIANVKATVSNNAHVTVENQLRLAAADADSAHPSQSLIISGGTVEVGSANNSGGQELQVDSGGIIIGHGDVTAAHILNNGKIEASEGTLILRGNFDDASSGTLQIDDNSIASLFGGFEGTVKFNGAYGTTLILNGRTDTPFPYANGRSGTLEDLQPGDTIIFPMSQLKSQWVGSNIAHTEIIGSDLIITPGSGIPLDYALQNAGAGLDGACFTIRFLPPVTSNEPAFAVLQFAEQSSKIITDVDTTDPNPYLSSLIDGWAKWAPGSTIFYHFGNPNEATHENLEIHGEDASVDCKKILLNWSDDQKAAYRAALDVIESVCDLHFQETNSVQNANIVAWIDPLLAFAGEGGHSEFPAQRPDGHLWQSFDKTQLSVGLEQGGIGFETIVHELGHALGLAHPHDGGLQPNDLNRLFAGVNNSSDYGDNLQNQTIYTAMSYNQNTRIAMPDGSQATLQPSLDWGQQGGLGAFDIAALQKLYGPTNFNGGNNTYYLPTQNSSGEDAHGVFTSWSSIWDTAGNDTISNDGSNVACVIDLRAAPLLGGHAGGHVSEAHDVVGGYTIANGVTIENATGGSGDDTLIGNSANNSLDGEAGRDTVRYEGNSAAYHWRPDPTDSNVWIVDGPDGHDTLINDEVLQFLDKTIDLRGGKPSGFLHWFGSIDVGAHPDGWLPIGIADFTHNRTSDLAWFNASNLDLEIWQIANGHWAASTDIGTHPAGWRPVGFADFNNDDTSDALWFNPTTLDIDLWKINDGHWAGSVDIGTHPQGYLPALTGDFNGDGTSDIAWYNAATGDIDLWKIANGQWAGSVDVGSHPAGYEPSLAGDFNGDGTSDIAWYNPTTGDVDIWKLSNGQWTGSVDVGPHPAGWQPLGAADFDQDGTTDIAWYNPTANDVEIWRIQNAQWSATIGIGTHPAGSVAIGLGDFDNNGATDIMWRNATTGHIENWMLAVS